MVAVFCHFFVDGAHAYVCACQSHRQASGVMVPIVQCTEELVMIPFNVIE